MMFSFIMFVIDVLILSKFNNCYVEMLLKLLRVGILNFLFELFCEK